MYKIATNTGTTIRIADNVQVAPGSATDPNYIEYLQWIENGGVPEYFEEVETINLPHIISALDFRDRFTTNELMAMCNAAYVGGNTMCQLLLLKVQTANSGIHLDSPETISGVNYLASIGIITTERIPEILE